MMNDGNAANEVAERERFEAAMFPKFPALQKFVRWTDTGRYVLPDVALAWDAWLAAKHDGRDGGKVGEIHRSAVISECGQFRYILRRLWDVGRPSLGFVMLNPSTADASQDDPTIRKCIGFADRLGFGGIVVTNLYAFRATDPKDLKAAGYQPGHENDSWIAKASRETESTVCAWGANARGLSRTFEVLDILRGAGRRPKALRLAPDGTPWHPLMLPYSCTLINMPSASGAHQSESKEGIDACSLD